MEVFRIPHVQGVEGPGQRYAVLGNTNIMNVVGHQAVGPDVEGIALGAVRRQVKIAPIILAFFEYGLIVVATLGNLVGMPGNCQSGKPGHLHLWENAGCPEIREIRKCCIIWAGYRRWTFSGSRRPK